MVDLHTLSIDDIGLSVRSRNALHRHDVHTVEDLLHHTEESLYKMNNLGAKSVGEILKKIRQYQEGGCLLTEGEASPQLDAEQGEQLELSGAFAAQYLKKQGLKLDALELLSTRAYNILRMGGYRELWQLVEISVEELLQIPYMDEKSAAEIQQKMAFYLSEHKDIYAAELKKEAAEKANQNKSFQQLLEQPEYRNALIEYTQIHDKNINQLGLSARSENQLQRNGYMKLSQILFLAEEDLLQMKNMGTTSAKQILEFKKQYLDSVRDAVCALAKGDTSRLWSDEGIKKAILELYDTAKFAGLSLSDIQEKVDFGPGVNQDRLKKLIGQLIAENELEYVDYRCYRVYGKFQDYIDGCPKISDRNKDMLRQYLDGHTMEEIGVQYDLTRSRIQQILKKEPEKIRKWYQSTTGKQWFDEEYYLYLYQTYTLVKKDAIQWLGMPERAWDYMELLSVEHGTADLKAALEDARNLPLGIRLRIKNYLNRNKIYVDHRWVEKNRLALEEVVARKYCSNIVSLDEFFSAYNQFLQDEGISYDENIYYTEAVRNTRKNALEFAEFIICSNKEQLRYYDIGSRDYTELFEGLNLDAYENVEINTAKFTEENPELMRKYDIRNHHELHNLLKKVLPAGSFHDIQYGKMPMLRFGKCDRTALIMDILREHSPMASSDLISLLHHEFGYDIPTITGGYLQPFSVYYHNGEYSVAQKPMSEHNKEILRNALTEDFYYIHEIQKLYSRLFPDADPEEVNAFNLKSMGLTVLSRYILPHHESMDAYCRMILTDGEIIDISSYKKRLGSIVMFGQVLADLKKELRIIEFAPDQYISLVRLEKQGISRKMLQDFCDAVYDRAAENTYFSVTSLQNDGFHSPLFELGFDTLFYSSVLSSDSRFSRTRAYGAYVFLKGSGDVTIQSFLAAIIRSAGSIDMLDLMNQVNKEFGCEIHERSDVLCKLQGSEVYYDDILDRIYANAELYYQELEDEDL